MGKKSQVKQKRRNELQAQQFQDDENVLWKADGVNANLEDVKLHLSKNLSYESGLSDKTTLEDRLTEGGRLDALWEILVKENFTTASLNDSDDIDKFRSPHRFYTMVRQQIMRYFNGMKSLVDGKTGERNSGALNDNGETVFEVKPKIDQADKEMLSAKVLEVRLSEHERRRVGAVAKPNLNLEKGAYTNEPRENMDMEAIKDVYTHLEVFKEAFKGIVERWCLDVQSMYEPDNPSVKEYLASPFSDDVLFDGMESFRRREFSEWPLEIDERYELLDLYKKLIYQDMLSGSIDKALGLDKFTTLELFDSARTVRNSVPNIFIEHDEYYANSLVTGFQLRNRTQGRKRDQTKELKRQKRNIGKRLRSIDRRIYRDYGSRMYTIRKGTYPLVRMVNGKLVGGGLLPPYTSYYGSTAQDFRSFLNRTGLDKKCLDYCITLKMARDSLGDYGLEQTFRFIDKRNFALDPKRV